MTSRQSQSLAPCVSTNDCTKPSVHGTKLHVDGTLLNGSHDELDVIGADAVGQIHVDVHVCPTDDGYTLTSQVISTVLLGNKHCHEK